MKRKIFCIVLMLIALVSFSQDKYTVKLESIYETEFDNLVSADGFEMQITIYNDSIVTLSGTHEFTYSILSVDKSIDTETDYVTIDSEGNFCGFMLDNNSVKLLFSLDPRMVYNYKILDYEVLQ